MPDYGYNENPYSEMDYYRRQQAMQRAQAPNPLQQIGNLAVNKAKDKAVQYGIDQVGNLIGGGDAVASAYPSVFNGGASAAAQLPTGGITPILNGSGYAGIGEGGSLTQGAAIQSAPGFFNTGGMLGGGEMSFGQYMPGVAGALGMADVLMNKKHGGKGALQGAASGAGIGFTLGGPIGAGVGALAGGTLGYFGNLGDEDKWKGEQDRADKLREAGVNWDVPSERLTKGRSKQELIDIARATGGNVKFAQSRDEKDLMPEDIWGYATFGERYKDKWLKGMNEQQRRAIGRLALDSGAVREHTGTIDVDWNKIDPSTLAALESGDSSNPDAARLLATKAANFQEQGAAQSGQGMPPGTTGQGQPQNAIWQLDPGYNLAQFQNYGGGIGGIQAIDADKARREEIAKSLLGRHKARLQSRD